MTFVQTYTIEADEVIEQLAIPVTDIRGISTVARVEIDGTGYYPIVFKDVLRNDRLSGFHFDTEAEHVYIDEWSYSDLLRLGE